MKILGLDIGEKRIGVAVSDELYMTAQGKTVILRSTLEKDIDKILNIIEAEGIKKIIVGLPINMDGSYGDMVKTVKSFVSFLSDKTSCPVETFDERLSSKMAENVLLEADVSRKKRKNVIDKLAAVNILQTYLDRLNQDNGQ